MCVRIRWSRVGILWSTLLVVLGVACASRGSPASQHDDLDRATLVRGRACDRSDQDTTRRLHLPLYRACAVTMAARRIATDMRPDFVPTGRDRNCFSALIEFAVDTLGRPEPWTARVVKASDSGFGAAALVIVPGLRFEPARLGGRPVRQLYELREVLVVRRGGWLERSPASRQASSSARTGQSESSGGSSAPSGADVPSLTNFRVC